MDLVTFPSGEPVMIGRQFDDGLYMELDEMLAGGLCSNGWLEIQTRETRLTCLFHQAKTYLAGLTEPESFSWVPLHAFPVRANQLDGAVCNVFNADPVRVLLMAVHFRNRPALQAPSDLVDLAHVLKVLADEGHDAALALERNRIRTLLFLQKGQPARVYFGDPSQDPGQGSVAERFLAHAFDPDAPLTKVEVFKRLSIDPDPDAGRSLAILSDEAKPPPPKNVLVRLGGRVVMQRPFMPPLMRIGRDHGCEVLLDNLSVSRRHAELAWERGKFVVRDLGSANGTKINGRAHEAAELGDDDRIQVGKFELRLIEPPDVQDPDPTMLLSTEEQEGGCADAPGQLYLIGDDQSVPVSGEITIGKTRGVDLKARGFFVKAVHVRVNVEPGEVIRLSCPSGSGVQLNGQQITAGFLKPGDELTVGRSKFRLVASLAGEPTNA